MTLFHCFVHLEIHFGPFVLSLLLVLEQLLDTSLVLLVSLFKLLLRLIQALLVDLNLIFQILNFF